MTIYSTIGLAAAVLILAASPGPGVFATAARALASGFRPSLAVIGGIVLGDVIFLLFAAFGLSVVARILGNLFFIVKICGAAYLIWLGVKIWLKTPEPVSGRHNPEACSWRGNFASGLFITLSNPKVILFYCGFLPTFLDLYVLTFIDLAVVVAIITTVLGGVLTTYAFLASRARKMFTKPAAVRRLNRAAGGVMVAAGVVIAIRS
ncbi:MAG: LysE family translocator [Deltaproteobacteria bacterium]|nr:LysE family translocator [Deltaproteobacteria bacterium]